MSNREADIVAPLRLPFPTQLAINCPICDAVIQYEPAEDDAGAFYAEQDWPSCDKCNVLVEVPPIRIERANGVYLQRGHA